MRSAVMPEAGIMGRDKWLHPTDTRVTGHLCGEFTGPRWIPLTKASDAGVCEM